jgi:hypothetical protein
MLAKQMMEKLRIAEEDEEFEKAFKQVLQVRHNTNTADSCFDIAQCHHV